MKINFTHDTRHTTHHAQRLTWAFFPFFFFLFTTIGLYAKGAPMIALSDLLDAQGHLVNKDNRSGSVDFSGYTPVIDSVAGLRFVPAPPLASGWNAVGSGMTTGNRTGRVVATADNGDVYSGLHVYTGTSGASYDLVFRHNGSTWSSIDGSTRGFRIHAIAISGSDVYVGGEFQKIGNLETWGIARWNSSDKTWNKLGSGLASTGYVYAIAISGSNVYFGGNSVTQIMRWNGSTLTRIGSLLSGEVYAIAVSGSNVYVGGDLVMFLNGSTFIRRLLSWNGTSWSMVGTTALNGSVRAIAISGNDVYAGGLFTDAGGNTNADYIARWNGSTWNALGTGLSSNSYVYAIAVSGSDVYVGGSFTNAGGNADADYIARWDGSSWQALGTGLNSVVLGIAVSGSNVYVTGHFTDAGGNPDADLIARWSNCTAPSITTAAAASTNPICSNATLDLSVVASGTAPLTYAWAGTGTFTNGTTATPSVTGAATGNYVVTVSNACGNVESTAAVTVNPSVTPSVSISANPGQAITAGVSVTFTATPTHGGTPSYQWKKNGTIVGSNQNTYTDASLANNDVIKCEMTSTATCASPSMATSNEITMQVCNCSPTCSPIPTAAGTYTGAISYTDGSGVTHYCDATGSLLLSTKPVVVSSTTVVPAIAVQIKIGATTATYYPKWCGGTTAADKCFMVKTPATGGNVLINRWWHIDAAQVTGTTVSATNQLQITTYFTNTEYTTLQSQMTTNSVVPALTSPTGLILYQPFANPVLAKFADPALVKPLTFTRVTNGTSVGVNLWQHSTPASGINQATFKVNSIVNSGGIGIF